MNTKLTANQQETLDRVNKHGPLFVGSDTPNTKRTFESLVRKGLLVATPTPVVPGWTKYSIPGQPQPFGLCIGCGETWNLEPGEVASDYCSDECREYCESL